MKLKQIADKYGLDYQLMYQILSNAKVLEKGVRADYDELSVVAVVSQTLFNRINFYKEKALKYLEVTRQINTVLKKNLEKRGE